MISRGMRLVAPAGDRDRKGGPRAAQLEPDAMLKLGLTTGPQSVHELTGATICKSLPKPDNCRVTPSTNAEDAAPPRL
ncbi:MAG: hypothetical protein EOS09_08390 [Mesorhizobium sp.]|nr:MAG: hypothetical protein EOS09_08390 [Mesorhizobium sp.]